MSDEVEVDVDVDVDVLIVGAGVTGIHQLYRALEEGFSALVLEEGEGVGGTWYWNRYPEARFDSESYTYGFLFSRELWEEWEWSEEYAGQPEVERYFNHVVDRFDLRGHLRLGRRVTAAEFEEDRGTWRVDTGTGERYRSRFLVAATGVLSVPFRPDLPGQDVFGGEQYHTGRWPDAVDLHGKRVAQIGTGSSGVQLVPALADVVGSLTVYQRVPDWCAPLNNAPISAERQAELKRDFESIKATLDSSPSGFLHDLPDRYAEADSTEQRAAFFETLWSSGGFRKLSSNYIDFLRNPVVNAEWCEFAAAKIRAIVSDPATAEALIPRDHGYGGRRPPFGTGYYEAYNKPTVSLVSVLDNPIVGLTETGVQTADGVVRDADVVIWATGWDFGTGALTKLGVHGRAGLGLAEHWKDGPRTWLGVAAAGFPNLFFPGGPHGSTGNNPRYNGDQVEFVTALLCRARERGAAVVEVTAAGEEDWTTLMNEQAGQSSFLQSSYFYGANIPGKPRRQLLNPTGRRTMQNLARETVDAGFDVFEFEAGP